MKSILLVYSLLISLQVFGQHSQEPLLMAEKWKGEKVVEEQIPCSFGRSQFFMEEGLWPPSPKYHQYLLAAQHLQGLKKSRKDGLYLTEIYAGDKARWVAQLPKKIAKAYGGGPLAWDETRQELIFSGAEGYQKDAGADLWIAHYPGPLQGLKGIVPFPHNTPDYRESDPALSPDGKVLFFASDRPGAGGGWSIWRSERQGQGWSQPVAVEAINGAGDERYPTWGPEGALYFASNSLHQDPAREDLDLYVWHFGSLDAQKVGSGGKIEALPYPLNSLFDDLGLTFVSERGFDPQGAYEGYLASNRPRLDQPAGRYLYHFKDKFATPVIAKHRSANVPIPNAILQVYEGGKEAFTLETGEDGTAYLYPRKTGSYLVRLDIPDFEPIEQSFYGQKSETVYLNTDEQEYFRVKVLVSEANSSVPKSGAEVKVWENNEQKFTRKTDSLGRLHLELTPGYAYRMEVDLPGYSYQSRDLVGKKGQRTEKKVVFHLSKKKGTYVEGKMKDRQGKALKNVPVLVYSDGLPVKLRHPLVSDEKGHFQGILPKDQRYTLLAWPSSGDLLWKDLTTNQYIDPGANDTLELEMQSQQLKKGGLLLRFLYGEDPILLQAAKYPEMHSLQALLESHPDLKVELQAHTDSRGDTEENLRKSQEAAEFAADYFFTHGIARDRIRPKGLGAQQLSNRCKTGADCSEAEHLENRRIEVRILEW